MSKNPKYYQFSLNTGLGNTNIKKVVDYKASSSGGFSLFGPSYHEVYAIKNEIMGLLGFNIYKRKRMVGFYTGVDVVFTESLITPLLKTGIQINIFNKKQIFN